MGQLRRSADKTVPALSVLSPAEYNPDGWSLDLTRMPECPDTARPRGSWQLDAKLWEGQFRENGTLAAFRVQRYDTRDKVRAQIRRLREIDKRVRRTRESDIDWFAYGGAGALPGYGSREAGVYQQYLPMLPGPSSRQQYWTDYFATSAKAFEAYHHDPIVHRSVHTTTQFVLGRGVEAHCKTERGQQAWEEFATRNRLAERLGEMDRDLSIFGELFIRYFQLPQGLVMRSLDPATIYEIVTDQEDRETVFFYHQQFSTRWEMYAPPPGDGGAPQGRTTGGTVKYVVRQIPAGEIDHVRINATSAEVRGRSDVFPSLGYVKRLRDLITSRVIKADLESRMAFKLSADGTPSDLAALKNALFPGGRLPNAGTVLAMNKAVDLEAFVFDASRESAVGDDIDALVNFVAVGLGVPKEYLGISSKGGGSRASALVATEPAAKRFEERQALTERVLHGIAARVFDVAGLTGDDRHIEFIFPEIVSEDRSAKLKDLAYAEGNQWISKKSSATAAAKELGYTTYDFDEEQKLIAAEFDKADEDKEGDGTIRRPVQTSDVRQVPKIDVTRGGGAADLPPGNLEPAPGEGAPDATGAAAQQTRAGFPADENPLSGRGAANIRQDNRLSEAAVGEIVGRAIRETARAVREPRRRPDDPAFKSAAERYRAAAEDSLGQLVEEAAAGTNGSE